MESAKVNCALALALFFWASAFVGIRIGLTSYSPGALALLRFLVASLCMAFIYARVPDKKKIPATARIQLMLIGVAGIGIYNICLNVGELTVSAGVASFVIGLMPVITLILSVVFLQEKPNSIVWLGILVSFVGLVLMVLGDKTAATMSNGVLIILISTFMGSFYNIMQKRYLQQFHPVAITAWVIWGGTVMLLWFAKDLGHEIFSASSEATTAAVYMGIFPAAGAYVAWCYILKHLPVSKACMYLYFLPVLSTILGFLLLHEEPGGVSLIGGVLALIGALIATRSPFVRLPKAATESL